MVVAARNEANNLAPLLQSLLNQDYPEEYTEVILVNDRSTDKTSRILTEQAAKHKRLKSIAVTATPEGVSPKKHALSQAILAAKGELIFTTDADCRPPVSWLSQTVPLFTKNIGVVIGFAPFHNESGLLSKLLQVDNLVNAFVAAGGAGQQVAITCTGRNFAYRKSVFTEVNGFAAIAGSLSGDDDLFLQLVTRKTNWQIAFCKDAGAAVCSPAARTLADFIRQRRRHVSAGKYYSKSLQFAYLLFNIANLSLFLCLAYAGYFKTGLLPVALLFSIKLLADFSALFCVVSDLKRYKYLFYFPLWEIFNLINQTLISPLGFIGKIKWKA